MSNQHPQTHINNILINNQQLSDIIHALKTAPKSVELFDTDSVYYVSKEDTVQMLEEIAANPDPDQLNGLCL